MGIKDIQNYYFPNWNEQRAAPNSGEAKRNLGRTISPVQLQRLRIDIFSWRDAISESELAYYPQRVKMQRMFNDTILDGHTWSCVERRKDLTMLRGFTIKNQNGEINKEWTTFFNNNVWFNNWKSYCLDALFFGYSLIALSDMIADAFPNLTIIKRWNVSPDRLNVTEFIYSLSGKNFTDEDVKDWHTWVPTVTDTGASNCGYGILYRVALYAIYLRNLLGQNADASELYAQPYRVGKTDKTSEDERAELESALQMMGSAGYALIDNDDTIMFLETAMGSTGYLIYDNFETRLEKKISKLILGHADAMDSTPGKLGGSKNDEHSPVNLALKAKKAKDGEFVESIFNGQLLTQLRNLGFNIPLGLKGEFKNDEEEFEQRTKEDAANLVTSEIYKNIKDSGGDPDWEQFTERTGINVEKSEIILPEPKEEDATKVDNPSLSKKIKNQLSELYGHNH